jgi:regulator of sirC expression with transglutaminase-like and TPR domain
MRDCNSIFAQIISTREEQMDVARAALLFACEAYPNLDIASYLGALDEMAATLRPQLAHEHPAIALGRFLSNDKGFHGNTDDFFDPRNSYLNQVLDRRTGIPISLSVIYLEVARRLNLPIVGIALPGHFVIRYDGDEEPLYLDPFNGGATLSTEDCRQRVADISDGRLPFRQSFLYPVGPRQILTRMLRNLKGIYVARTDFELAIPVIEKLILLNPSKVEEIRDLGMLYYYAGQQSRAIGCLEKYLSLAPDAEDRKAVQHNLGTIISKVARWN